jgi:hypothetical protein
LSIKKFLKSLTDDGRYYAEMVDNLAEIYYLNDSRPCALVELEKQVYHINFRSDLAPNIVAQVLTDLYNTGVSIVIGPVFAITKDKGIAYGEEAMGMHYINVFLALQPTSSKDTEETKDVIFIVKDPIPAFQGKIQKRTDKIHKKIWGE